MFPTRTHAGTGAAFLTAPRELSEHRTDSPYPAGASLATRLDIDISGSSNMSGPVSAGRVALLSVALAALLPLTACSDLFGPSGSQAFVELECSVSRSALMDGGPPPDGIPSLQNPQFVGPDSPEADYLRDRDRVIGIVVDGEAWAIPHNIGWWHEIVNMDFDSGAQLAVTYCPLTGSSLVFDREAVGGATFGVSGLLFQNNLILFDRNDPASLWFQMDRQARCGNADGTRLAMYPSMEPTWFGWRSLHPETRVVGSATGIDRDYEDNPYGNYERTDELLFGQPNVDTRRFVKERTLGVPEDDGQNALVVPFGELEDAEDGVVAVARGDARGAPVVIFWDERVQGAMAFRPVSQGTNLTFSVEGDRIVDQETGSSWRVDGVAEEGPLAGQRLEAIPEAYVAFWFAWIAFHPAAEMWEGA